MPNSSPVALERVSAGKAETNVPIPTIDAHTSIAPWNGVRVSPRRSTVS